MSKPRNLQCLSKKVIALPGSGERVPVPCGRCASCQRDRIDTLAGRILAEAMGCARVLMVNLTFDDAKGPEARFGARFRRIEPVQRMQKRWRAKEQWELRRYNERERAAAEAEGRAPRLVDASRSYIKFLPVFERGKSGTERGHFHVLVFLGSHFPVPDAVLQSCDLHEGMAAARRVWDFPELVREPTERLPPEAHDPDVIDWAVKTAQEWRYWELGRVNFRCCTHEVQGGVWVPKGINSLPGALVYVTKYLTKDIEADLAGELPEHMRRGYQGVSRSCSRDMGRAFFEAHGRKHAEAGLPIEPMEVRFRGVFIKRTEKSEKRWTDTLRAQGVPEWKIVQMVRRERRFPIKGVARAWCLLAFSKAFEARTGHRPSLRHLGNVSFKVLMELESAEMARFLDSFDARGKRYLAELQGRKLTAELVPVRVFEVGEDGLPDNGELIEGAGSRRRPCRPRSPRERYLERVAANEAIRAEYDGIPLDRSAARTLRREVASLPLDELLSESVRARRERVCEPRFKAEAMRQEFEGYCEELRQRVRAGDDSAAEDLEFALSVQDVEVLPECELPRHTLVHPAVPSHRLLAWLNFADDFAWPKLREEAVARFFEVEPLGDGLRLLTRRHDGARFLQRAMYAAGARLVETDPLADSAELEPVRDRAEVLRRAVAEAVEAGELEVVRVLRRELRDVRASIARRASGLTRQPGYATWATRRIRSDEELAEARAGALPVYRRMRAPLFEGPEPFGVSSEKRPTPARELSALHGPEAA